MKKYKEFIIKTDPFIPELVSGVLWDLNISGIVENEDDIKVYADTEVTVNLIEAKLESLAAENIISVFHIEEHLHEFRNWNKEWEEKREIIRVSDRIVIKPSFRSYTPAEGEIVITIDPKMSFGTGEHATTRMVLQLLGKYIKPGMRVLDVGCGTGILAIASVKLGAASAAAIDFDDICIANGLENCSINNVQDKIEIRPGEIADISERNFDLITANIQKNVLIERAGEIRNRLRRGGITILSGLLNSDEEEIDKIYRSLGFQKAELKQLDEWISVVYQF